MSVSSAARRPLGRTSLSVPAIGFGTSALGNMPDTYGYEVDPERGRATIRAILDGPVKFIDTSRNYGAGRSESLIGDVLRERGGLAADVVPTPEATPVAVIPHRWW